jgi:hypothetical protein
MPEAVKEVAGRHAQALDAIVFSQRRDGWTVGGWGGGGGGGGAPPPRECLCAAHPYHPHITGLVHQVHNREPCFCALARDNSGLPQTKHVRVIFTP